MKCKEVNQMLDDYLAGLLSNVKSASIEEHLERCSHCSQLLLIDDVELDELLHASGHYALPSPGFAGKVMQQIGKKKKSSWIWWVVAWSGYMSLCALGVVAVLLRGRLPWVMALASDVLSVVRSLTRVFMVIIEAMSFYRISDTGLIFIFSMATITFCVFGLINKEELVK